KYVHSTAATIARSEARPCGGRRVPRRISRLVSESANSMPSRRRMSARLCSNSGCIASTKRPCRANSSAAASPLASARGAPVRAARAGFAPVIGRAPPEGQQITHRVEYEGGAAREQQPHHFLWQLQLDGFDAALVWKVGLQVQCADTVPGGLLGIQGLCR